jgi:hypothetical protein
MGWVKGFQSIEPILYINDRAGRQERDHAQEKGDKAIHRSHRKNITYRW